MPEFRRFIWEWQSLLDQLAQIESDLGNRMSRACRPIAAEREPDGRLLLVVGCWVAEDRAILSQRFALDRLEDALKRMLKETISVRMVPWPAGEGEPDVPPDPFAGLDERVRIIGSKCDTVLVRMLFAGLARAGVVFECGYPVLNFRLDLASPQNRIGVEVGGWLWKSRTRPNVADGRQREQELGFEGWRVLWFSGEDVAFHLDRCVDEILALPQFGRRRSQPPQPRPGPPRRTDEFRRRGRT